METERVGSMLLLVTYRTVLSPSAMAREGKQAKPYDTSTKSRTWPILTTEDFDSDVVRADQASRHAPARKGRSSIIDVHSVLECYARGACDELRALLSRVAFLLLLT